MGTSENKLCYDLLHKRVRCAFVHYSESFLSQSNKCNFLLQMTKPDMLHVDPSLLQYPDWRGHAL